MSRAAQKPAAIPSAGRRLSMMIGKLSKSLDKSDEATRAGSGPGDASRPPKRRTLSIINMFSRRQTTCRATDEMEIGLEGSVGARPPKRKSVIDSVKIRLTRPQVAPHASSRPQPARAKQKEPGVESEAERAARIQVRADESPPCATPLRTIESFSRNPGRRGRMTSSMHRSRRSRNNTRRMLRRIPQRRRGRNSGSGALHRDTWAFLAWEGAAAQQPPTSRGVVYFFRALQPPVLFGASFLLLAGWM